MAQRKIRRPTPAAKASASKPSGASAPPAPWLARPRLILRVEGLLLFAATAYFFSLTGMSWWYFLACFFLPDLGLLGHLVNSKVGAVCYNLTHSTVGPWLLTLGLALAHHEAWLWIPAVWLAHEGYDRLMAYGLMYPGSGKDNHIVRL